MIAALGVVLFGGCGPTELESGQAVLFAAVPITLIGWLLQMGYRRLLQHIHPAMNGDKRPAVITLIAPAVLLVASCLTRGVANFEDWAGFALVFVGTSYLTLHCMLLVVLARARQGRWFHLSSALPWVVLGTPAVFLAFAGSANDELAGAVELLWVLPGYAGMVAGPVLAIAFGLAVYERRVHARRVAESEPVFPTARVVDR